ncbi:hypothetical protein ACFSB0_10710 [Aeromicrobium camelliae]
MTVNGSTAAGTVDATMTNITDTRNPWWGAGEAIILLSNFGMDVSCHAASSEIEVNVGAGVSPGSVIGVIENGAFPDCTTWGPLGLAVSMSWNASHITVREHPYLAGDPIPVDVHLDARVVGVGCDFDIQGSLRGTLFPGDATHDGYLRLEPGYDAVVTRAGSSGSSCGGEWWEGDLLEAAHGTFAINTSGPGAGLINHS